MGENYLTNPASFLIEVIIGLYALIVMLRFMLQWVRADFYNPVSQFIVKATAPVLNPLRRIIPGIAGIDVAALLLVWVILTVKLILLFSLQGGASITAAMLLAIPEMIEMIFNIFIYSILALVILSWVNPNGYNPAIGLIHSLTSPVMNPLRRIIPSAGGIDFTPMIAMVALYLAQMLILPLVKHLIINML
jgi:YggT family protein